MQKSTGIFLISLCITMIVVAGCTGAERANTTPETDVTPVATPSPQIVYVTVFVTQTPSGTSETTAPALNQDTMRDEEFIDYIDSNQIVEGMTTLSATSAGSYSISTGYNSWSKSEATRLTELLLGAPIPGSESVKTFRSSMMDALALMDGSTAGFSRYRDAMQTVIQARNTALSEMHSQGSAVIDATHLSGYGDDIQWYNTTETGQKTFSMHHDGDSNFAITLKDADGKYISLLANEIGEYSGKKSERLAAGDYYLEITADGEWTIGITSA